MLALLVTICGEVEFATTKEKSPQLVVRAGLEPVTSIFCDQLAIYKCGFQPTPWT